MFEKYVLTPITDSIVKFSDRNSLYINGTYYSYRDLAINISKIRSCLKKGSFSGEIIGLIANDDIETYASILAAWLEGLAYVPIHPKHPTERGLEIIAQAGIDLIIDSSSHSMFRTVNTIETPTLIFEEMNLVPKKATDNDLAYILFTSGSTGKPKGVPITRGNIASFMRAFWKVGFRIDENDRCLQCFDLTFDVSIQSFLVPLSKGACTYTIPHDQIKFSYAYGLLEEQKVTFGAMAPSLVRFLRPYFDEINLPDLRYNILTAEASPVLLMDEWAKCVPNAEIYDFYGPTETTIYCTYYKYVRNGINKHLKGISSIGKAMEGLETIIIDENRKPLGPYQQGELCIAGAQVTRGYWKSPSKNQESFFEINYNGTLTRYYRTGDSCYFDDKGDIMYLGRLDYQVKVQGYRVELGEIEFTARELINGRNAVAVAFGNDTGNTEIALFIEGGDVENRIVSDNLKLKLPYYMIPSKIIAIESFPLNANSKIDRNVLQKMVSV
jgi:D-alanine--poly(phosphoribitol) ligase subunit 1